MVAEGRPSRVLKIPVLPWVHALLLMRTTNCHYPTSKSSVPLTTAQLGSAAKTPLHMAARRVVTTVHARACGKARITPTTSTVSEQMLQSIDIARRWQNSTD